MQQSVYLKIFLIFHDFFLFIQTTRLLSDCSENWIHFVVPSDFKLIFEIRNLKLTMKVKHQLKLKVDQRRSLKFRSNGIQNDLFFK